MDDALAGVLAVAGGAAFASLAGGIVPLCCTLSERVRGYLLHFAAGVLLAVIAVELLPDIRDLGRPSAMLGGLAAGATAMIALNVLTRRLEARSGDDAAFPTGLVVAAGVDSVVDGLLVGIGYAADPELGLLLAVGIGIEKFAMTMTVAAELRSTGRPAARVVACALAIALALVPAVLAGNYLLSDPRSATHSFLLSAAAAALLYLVAIELVARGRETHDTPATVVAFFAGFVGIAGYITLSPA